MTSTGKTHDESDRSNCDSSDAGGGGPFAGNNGVLLWSNLGDLDRCPPHTNSRSRTNFRFLRRGGRDPSRRRATLVRVRDCRGHRTRRKPARNDARRAAVESLRHRRAVSSHRQSPGDGRIFVAVGGRRKLRRGTSHAPSPQLRRYVSMLRQIEYHPSTAPQTLAAVRSLERARQKTAGKLLMESRGLLENEKQTVAPPRIEVAASEKHEPTAIETKFAPSVPLSFISPPPPISTVLHDVYPEETSVTN